MSAVPIDVDLIGPTAPPRLNGELRFDAPWQGRAFGMCLALLERNGHDWDAFRAHLVPEIESAPDRPYYDSFVAALEKYVAAAATSSRAGEARAALANRSTSP